MASGLILRVRQFKDEPNRAIVWLIRREGIAEHCLLFGEMLTEKAKRLFKELRKAGVILEREKWPLPYVNIHDTGTVQSIPPKATRTPAWYGKASQGTRKATE